MAKKEARNTIVARRFHEWTMLPSLKLCQRYVPCPLVEKWALEMDGQARLGGVCSCLTWPYVRTNKKARVRVKLSGYCTEEHIYTMEGDVVKYDHFVLM